MAGPLEGVTVLDLTSVVAGPYATKLLADYGARVIKAEPRGGDPARSFGPFPDSKPDREASGLFMHLNINKQSIVLDPHTDDGAATVRRLAQIVDVVVEDLPPGEAEAAGWGWDTLHSINPRLIMCSITPYGQSGPYRDYRGSRADHAGDRRPAARHRRRRSRADQSRRPLRRLPRRGDRRVRDPAGPQTRLHRLAGRRLDRHFDLPMSGRLPRPAHHSPARRRIQRRRPRPSPSDAAPGGFRHVPLRRRLRQHRRRRYADAASAALDRPRRSARG